MLFCLVKCFCKDDKPLGTFQNMIDILDNLNFFIRVKVFIDSTVEYLTQHIVDAGWN